MKRNRVIKICENCGKEVEVIKSRENSFKYCSRRCHGLAVLSKIDQSLISRKFGKENNRWKGGYRKHSNGYVWKLVSGKYILEHRYVMETYIGRKLIKGEQVHHLNGDKLDNRLENLQLMTISQHTKLHNPRLGTGNK